MSSTLTSTSVPMSYITSSTGGGYPINGNSEGDKMPHIPYIPSRITGIDNNGKIEMNHNNVHIQPTNNGFIVTCSVKYQENITMCFEDWNKVIDYISNLGIMDLDNERVAENV